MDPLQFTITWYKNRHTGEQTAHWDLQNKATYLNILLFWKSQWAVCSPACDRKLQRAHYNTWKFKLDTCY